MARKLQTNILVGKLWLRTFGMFISTNLCNSIYHTQNTLRRVDAVTFPWIGADEPSTPWAFLFMSNTPQRPDTGRFSHDKQVEQLLNLIRMQADTIKRLDATIQALSSSDTTAFVKFQLGRVGLN